jgi:FkbM family methyltransferase
MTEDAEARVVITEQNHRDDLTNIMDYEPLRSIAKRGIIHVGAHEGQEVDQYFRLGFERILLVEANPEAYDVLTKRFGADARVKIFNYAICDREGVVDLHVHTSRSGSTEAASLLAMKRFNEIVTTLHTPRTIPTPAVTLDALFERHPLRRADYNYMNIDIQGAEILAFKGATSILASMDVIISEVSLIDLYEGGPLEAEVVAFLGRYGFAKRRALYHTLYDATSTFPAWGECLFTKTTLHS